MLQNANKIYKELEDDESKDIFESRLLYSITNDIAHIDKIVKIFIIDGTSFFQRKNQAFCRIC